MVAVGWIRGLLRVLTSPHPRAEPAVQSRVLSGEDRAGFEGGTWVRMPGAEQYRDPLLKVLGTIGPVAPCLLVVDAQPSGEWTGGPRIHAVVQYETTDVEVGVVEAQYRTTEAAFFDRVFAGARTGWVLISTDSTDAVFGRVVVNPDPGTGRVPTKVPVPRRVSHGQRGMGPSFPQQEDFLPRLGGLAWMPDGRGVRVVGDERVASVLREWLGGLDDRGIYVVLSRNPVEPGHELDVRVTALGYLVGWLGWTSRERQAELVGLVEAAEAAGRIAVARAEVVRGNERPFVIVRVAT